MNVQHLARVVVSVSLAACSLEINDGAGGSGGGAGGAGEAGGGGGSLDAGATLDLFACGVVPDCVQSAGHLGDELTTEAVRCGGELAAAELGGAILRTSEPGPYATKIEGLVVFGADGVAYEQTRMRCAEDGGCGAGSTADWYREELRRCIIDVDPAAIAGCGSDVGECAWYGQLKDCVPVDTDWTCAALPQ